jgi:methane/ammonia monooxygenase subunit B
VTNIPTKEEDIMRVKQRIAKWSVVGLLLALAAGLYAPAASAHGEKSQAAFMRMRTVLWYDLAWSKEVVKVNEDVEITGKFHLFSGWPETVAEPDVSFLNIGIPGPVFVRKESYIGGQLTPRSARLEIGKTYEFKVVLRARRPGDWHVHTMLSVQGGGPIIGPGKWVTIEGSMSDFRNQITTLTGQNIDLETYNLGNTYFWHSFWWLFGAAWLIYWVRRPIFLPRWLMVEAGRADELVSATDKKVGMGFLVATILIVTLSMSSTNSQYPITIPLQAGVLRGTVQTLNLPPQAIQAKVNDATYRVPGRAMSMTLTLTNNGDKPVRLAEFYAASVRFLDSDVYKDDTGYPEDLLAEDGLQSSDNSALAPGETRTVKVTVADAAGEVYRLSDIIYDPDSRFAGLLFFVDAQGNRLPPVPIDAPLIPSFL